VGGAQMENTNSESLKQGISGRGWYALYSFSRPGRSQLTELILFVGRLAALLNNQGVCEIAHLGLASSGS
jgi:hypothetical protein